MSANVVRVLKAGAAYFGVVFAVGFALGLVRVPVLEPLVGVRWAELVEMPFMLVAIVLAARWVVHWFEVPGTLGARIGMGAVALALLVGAELGVVLALRGMTFAEYVASRDPISGTVYLVMLAVFAIAPRFVASNGAAERRGA